MKQLTTVLVLALAACAPAGDTADASEGATFAAIDTLKPDPTNSMGNRDTIPAPGTATPATTKTAATQPATGTKTGTMTGTTSPKDTTNIGRDRAIQIDTKDPKVWIPTVDTTKTKRPPR